MATLLHHLSSRLPFFDKWLAKCSKKLKVSAAMTESISSAWNSKKTSKPRYANVVRLLPVLSVMIGFTACRTATSLAPVNLSEPGWTIRQGQAVWRQRHATPEVAGELLVAAHRDGRTLVQFTKTPVPFLVAQITSNAWQIRFVAENRTYSGYGLPPTRLGWLFLARCLNGISPPHSWRWQDLDEGRWRLENEKTGELLEGFLAP
jgi:hypothetical protein